MNSIQRKVLVVAFGAAVVFVWASYTIGEEQIHWALQLGGGLYGLWKIKSSVFVAIADGWFDVPVFVAAALVSLAFTAVAALLLWIATRVRRAAIRHDAVRS